MGSVNRAPTPEELERMRGMVRDGMRAGAFGLMYGTLLRSSDVRQDRRS